MQPAEASQADSAAGVVPEPTPSAAWRVTAVEPLDDARLRVTFADGTSGDVDLRRFLDSGSVNGTIFEPLRDPAFFRQVRVELGVPTWPNGADLAPDAMYDAIREQGQWLVGA